ncbi:MAG: flagellar motor protein MotB [Alphaproteobacteria bacterium]|nr:flagellar motor protein MotB [Alphaproteobacteria bacterium]
MAAKEAPPVEEEEADEECPKCPPVGAPAWMATFADMATLLMAFFVLILSFAEFNVPKFKQISGSMKDSFGVQKIIPVVEQPKGTTLLQLSFSPSPSPSVIDEVTSDTQDTTKPELEQPTDNDQSQGSDQLQEGAEMNEGLGGKDKDGGTESPESTGAERLADAINQLAANSDIEARVMDGTVVVDLKTDGATPEELTEKFKKVGQAIEMAEIASNQETPEILFAGVDSSMTKLAAMVDSVEDQLSEKVRGSDGQNEGGTGGSQTGGQPGEETASLAQDELQIRLADEIAQGLVQVERRDGKVFVTLGSGGAFPSGSADLTSRARDILQKISTTSVTPNTSVTVTGHTDNVPISSVQFRDNWDLAAARASSVVQQIEAFGMISSDKMRAVSQGENNPIADNNTPEGREQNRRIEIEINY